ncbi:histidine phosphatase family protein [Paenibacillus sp. J2TS4]|uniref:histidine phosphatase family protein n=1 Tax=Paenibacillus sp. J2TS4 TaxID=2807194 RepID=UPI001B23AA76|nr:histidine phosphatase family protein [Paenibacillus sp. J2TS4]GIP36478.1 putative phosphoglycerate mutase GpmB [Paenibacillus sp. J2TS4]
MIRIGLIRHGETAWNAERRAQGQSDIPLNELGRQQARALAVRLRKEPWDSIYSSDLSRAKETADIVAGSMGLKVQTDPRLREMHKGETEGTTLAERINRWGEQWETLPLGIEEDRSIIGRGTSFLSEIVETSQGKSILVVSHGALIGLTVRSLVPHLDVEAHFHNTSITIINYNGSEWDCELFNCARHIVG